MKKIKIGLVGCGNIAKVAHMPYLTTYEKYDLVAVCDICEERAKSFAETYKVPHWFTSIEDMLANVELDAVDVCTWNAAHAPCVIAAARAGKDILCEKPMAESLDSAKKMMEEVNKAGVKFTLAVPNRWAPQNVSVKELIDNGALGDIYMAKGHNIRRRATPEGWFTDKRYAGHGCIIDIGVHRIDSIWFLMGCPKPVSVSAKVFTGIGEFETKGITRYPGRKLEGLEFDIDDAGAGCIKFENGSIMIFEVSDAINGPDSSKLQLYGTKAGVVIDGDVTLYSERNGFLTDEKIQTRKGTSYEFELKAFADYVCDGAENKYPMDLAIQMQAMLEAIYVSSDTGNEVKTSDLI